MHRLDALAHVRQAQHDRDRTPRGPCQARPATVRLPVDGDRQNQADKSRCRDTSGTFVGKTQSHRLLPVDGQRVIEAVSHWNVDVMTGMGCRRATVRRPRPLQSGWACP